MKKLRLRFIQRMNVLLASIITFLGFSGCKQQKNIAENTAQEQLQPAITEEPIAIKSDSMKNEPLVCKYGVPTAKQLITGIVVDDKNRPLQNMRVVVEDMNGHNDYVNTDSIGQFVFSMRGMPIDSMKITVLDERGLYMAESRTIHMNYEGGDHEWDFGQSVSELRFVLQRSERQLKKYGTPSVRKTDTPKQPNPLPEGKPIK